MRKQNKEPSDWPIVLVMATAMAMAALVFASMVGCATHRSEREARCDYLHNQLRHDLNDTQGGLHDIVHEINIVVGECGA